MRDYQITIKHNGVGFEGWMLDNDEIEEGDHENPMSLADKIESLKIIKSVVQHLRSCGIISFEINKV